MTATAANTGQTSSLPVAKRILLPDAHSREPRLGPVASAPRAPSPYRGIHDAKITAGMI